MTSHPGYRIVNSGLRIHTSGFPLVKGTMSEIVNNLTCRPITMRKPMLSRGKHMLAYRQPSRMTFTRLYHELVLETLKREEIRLIKEISINLFKYQYHSHWCMLCGSMTEATAPDRVGLPF